MKFTCYHKNSNFKDIIRGCTWRKILKSKWKIKKPIRWRNISNLFVKIKAKRKSLEIMQRFWQKALNITRKGGCSWDRAELAKIRKQLKIQISRVNGVEIALTFFHVIPIPRQFDSIRVSRFSNIHPLEVIFLSWKLLDLIFKMYSEINQFQQRFIRHNYFIISETRRKRGTKAKM